LLLRLTTLDSLHYFWRPTGGLAGTNGESATHSVLAHGLSVFNPHRRANNLPWNVTIANDDKGGNLATTTAVHRTVM